MRQKISPKFHVKNGVKNGIFHANFTLPGRSAESLVSVQFFARDSGARNGCEIFMGAWHFLVLSAGKTPMPIKFLLLGGVSWNGGG